MIDENAPVGTQPKGAGEAPGAAFHDSYSTPTEPETQEGMLAAALDYARHGWPVFPLHTPRPGGCSCGDPQCPAAGKHPRTVHGYKDATTDAAAIRAWWGRWPDANIGIAPGPARLLVLDVDPRAGGDVALADLIAEHGRLPDTPTVITGGGGQHFYFLSPNGHEIPSRDLGDGLEVKAATGHIVAPPSLHKSGRRYEWEALADVDTPLATAPAWLIPGPGATQTREGAKPVPEVIAEGNRHTTLLSLAGSVRRRGGSEAEIMALLRATNEARCTPPVSEAELAGIARSVATYAPGPMPPALPAVIHRMPDAQPGMMPALPSYARLDPAIGEGAGVWVGDYIRAARQVSPMTPDLFHESAALVLGAVAIARRLVLHLSHGDLYPNLYVGWIAVTSLFRKSTAMDFARENARYCFPHLLAPEDTTPEAFLSDLAGAEPVGLDKLPDAVRDMWKQERNYAGQRGLFIDEFSGLLATADKDYGLGLMESFLRLYDCYSSFTRSSRAQGRVTVRNSYLSILGASTPSAMAEHLGNGLLWGKGFWPRFALLTPDIERPEWQQPGQRPDIDVLSLPLRLLYARLPPATWPEPPGALSVTLGDGVFDAWENYSRALGYDLLGAELDTRLWGSYNRLVTMSLKVAMILAALDWPEDMAAPRIELRHLARAMGITETWRASAHRVIDGATASGFDRLQRRISRQLAIAGKDGATVRDIHQQMRDLRPSDIEMTLQEMMTAGEVEVLPRPASARGGRPTKLYRLSTE
jgi:hypothetical protein